MAYSPDDIEFTDAARSVLDNISDETERERVKNAAIRGAVVEANDGAEPVVDVRAIETELWLGGI